jgi:predicted XRE-type DNA-binding protein
MAKNVFEDLGFSPEEAAALKLKADLHSQAVKRAARYSQKQLQSILDESQPRVSDLLWGKMSKFSLEMLVIYAEKLGLRTEIRTKKARSRGAAAGSRSHALAVSVRPLLVIPTEAGANATAQWRNLLS